MAEETAIAAYNQKILSDLLHNENDALSRALIAAIDNTYLENRDGLIYQNIFPHLRPSKIQTEAPCLLTFAVDMPETESKNPLLKDVTVTFHVIVPPEQMRLSSDTFLTRTDHIASILTGIFGQNPNYGASPLEYVSDLESVLPDGRPVRTLTFRFREIRRL